MRRQAIYIEGKFAGFARREVNAGPDDLPTGVAIYGFEQATPDGVVLQPGQRLRKRVVDDHKRKVRRVVWEAEDSALAMRVEIDRMMGSRLGLLVALDLKNELRALRGEKPLTLDEFRAELVAKL